MERNEAIELLEKYTEFLSKEMGFLDAEDLFERPIDGFIVSKWFNKKYPIMESMEIKAMRNMAWERAKGELNSMKQTFVSNTIEDKRYDELKKAINDFITYVEDNGLQE